MSPRPGETIASAFSSSRNLFTALRISRRFAYSARL